MRDQAMHDFRIDGWDERVIIPMQYQCWLPQFVEPENARPTRCAQHLREITGHAAHVCDVCKLPGQRRLLAYLAPVDFSSNPRHVSRVLIALWYGYFQQSRWLSGYHQRPGSRADQD